MTGAIDRNDARLEEASEWIVRLQRGGEAEALAFDAWLQSSEANRQAFDSVMGVLDEIGSAAPQLRAEDAVQRRRPEPRFSRRFYLGLGGLAAAAAVAVAVAPQALLAPATETYTTAVGHKRTLSLADGSIVEMNVASRMEVTLARKERRVVMGEGEAVFDVAHDARRPFLIHAGDRTVRVVGTRFDVRHRGDQLSVTVAEGLVEVRSGEKGRTFRLRPGQRLDHRAGSAQVQVAQASPEEVFGWRVGRLVYRDRPLREVVADLNLHFPQPLRVEDERLASTRVSGVLVLDDQPAVIRRLGLLTPISAVPSERGILLRRPAGTK
ncbi:FecR family protein [Phenylobacterium deserti]|uniref:Iron dicitrate transport regulator FecR n=1 Tax=Phenylobacterium deserti TaxID=1914756 RepID=A0A328ASZ1_9CAUL|nr:FecR domain-containing protein [Phenylobacterium deserti]RAK57669.1 iron dicitrate transport regulator FecR [Phenylobacterium deserti]